MCIRDRSRAPAGHVSPGLYLVSRLTGAPIDTSSTLCLAPAYLLASVASQEVMIVARDDGKAASGAKARGTRQPGHQGSDVLLLVPGPARDDRGVPVRVRHGRHRRGPKLHSLPPVRFLVGLPRGRSVPRGGGRSPVSYTHLRA